MTKHNQELDNKGEEVKYLTIYLAGLWDGEGSFMLVKIANRRSPNKNPMYVPTAQICMTINGHEN